MNLEKCKTDKPTAYCHFPNSKKVFARDHVYDDSIHFDPVTDGFWSQQGVTCAKGCNVKTFSMIVGVMIAVFGAAGIVFPPIFIWVAQQTLSSEAFYVVAAVRLMVGGILISVAGRSRLPRIMFVVGLLMVLSGIAAAVLAMVAINGAVAILTWWMGLGMLDIRLTGMPLLAIGGLMAYACGPVQDAVEA